MVATKIRTRRAEPGFPRDGAFRHAKVSFAVVDSRGRCRGGCEPEHRRLFHRCCQGQRSVLLQTASSFQRGTAIGVPSRILIDIESTRTGLAELPPAKPGLA